MHVSDFVKSELVGLPLELIVAGEHLISVDITDSSAFRWYDISDPNANGDFGSKGRGPGEFTRSWSLQGLG